MALLNRLSIRSYTQRMRSHFHEYHQLVLPLRGSINIKVGDYSGRVNLGDCVVIQAGQQHDFHADEAARFLVADLDQLPANLTESSSVKFSISSPLLAHLKLEIGYWDFNVSEWLGIILLGLGPVGGSFYLWDIGLKHGNKQLLASLSFSAPLISSIALSLAGINSWSFNIILALCFILAGALLANMKSKQSKAIPVKA